MARFWSVRLKRGDVGWLPKGFSIQVTTQGDYHNYPDLIRALDNEGYTRVRTSGGIWSDDFWEWS